MKIEFLTFAELNKKKWDHTVAQDLTALPYAYSDYITLLCGQHWGGLVLGDYEFVFPLAFNRKKILYAQVYQPLFCQQWGIYGRGEKSKELVNAFLTAIPAKFKEIGISLKSDNCLSDNLKGKKLSNFILELNPNIDEIRKQYDPLLIKNLDRAIKSNLSFSYHETFNFKTPENKRLLEHGYYNFSDDLKKKGFAFFIELLQSLVDRKWIRVAQVFSEEGVLLAMACVLGKGKRKCYLVSATNKQGRKNNATHFLIDKIIEKEKEVGTLLFDFEGSTLPGVAKFYTQFNPLTEEYFYFHRDAAPFLFRSFISLIKKN